MNLCAMAFVAGMVYEWGCVFWVHSSERGNVFMAALTGAIIALCQVTGLIDAIHGFWPAVSLIMGYGFGSGTAVFTKNQIAKYRK